MTDYARRILLQIVGDSTGFTKATTDATAATSKFQNVLQGIGQGLGQAAFHGVQEGIQAVEGFISDAIGQADLLNKSIGKSDVVFGTSVGVIDAWANQAAQAIGLSATAALDAADAVGNLGVSAGLTQDKAAKLSVGVVNLAADLGSFNNMSTDDALTALEAGLAGSTKALKSLGVVMTAHEVEQQAMADGAVKVNGAFTDAALIQARYEVILQKSSLASGDFARNTGSLADAQARSNAELENAQAELGQHFLPVQIAVTNSQNDFFKGLGVVNRALGNFGNMLNDSYKSVDIFAADVPIATAAAQGFGVQLDMTSAHAGKAADDIASMADVTESFGTDTKRILSTTVATDVSSGWDALGETAVTKIEKIGKKIRTVATGAFTTTLDLNPLIVPDSKRLQALYTQLATVEGNRDRALKAHDSGTVQRDDATIAKLEAEINALVRANDSNYGGQYGNKMASGGLVKASPGGTNVILAEAGEDEFVIPRSKMGGGGGRVQFIPIPVPMFFTPGMQQAWAREAGPAMARWMQQSGLLPKFGQGLRG